MLINKTRVLVVGGGATGVGIIRDLALRGIDAVLVEQQDLAHGASFRFHGLLHSGARYAVKDPSAAKECMEENLILNDVASTCVKKIGGLFLQHELDDDSYVAKWLDGCKQSGIGIKEISVKKLLEDNAFLTKSIKRAYQVPDGIIDGSRLVWANVYQAIRFGAKVFTYTKLNGILTENNKVTGAEVINTLTGEKAFWECEVIINAAGTWADQIASLAGIKLNLIKNKGSLLVFNQRFTPKVINRLRTPSDGDIIVPHHNVTILGTTSIDVDNPNATEATSEEVNVLLNAGKELVPGIGSYRVLRAYAGVRPLYVNSADQSEDSRNITRDFIIIDHGVIDGLNGLISLVGGKLTTYRLIAEKTVNYVGKLIGEKEPCSTDKISLIDKNKYRASSGQSRIFVQRYGDRSQLIDDQIIANPEKASILCECEDVSYAEVEEVASWEDTHNMDDLRRKTRIGMGTCQGLYCSFRSLGVAWKNLKKKTEPPMKQLRSFLENRYKGQKTLLWDSQIRENELTLGVYSTIFNLERSEEEE